MSNNYETEGMNPKPKENLYSKIFDSLLEPDKELVYFAAGIILDLGNQICQKLNNDQKKVINLVLTDSVNRAFPIDED